MTEPVSTADAERDLQCIAIGMALANNEFRQRLDPHDFVDSDLRGLAAILGDSDKAKRWETVWTAFELNYGVTKHDGRFDDAVLHKLRVDAETNLRLGQIAKLTNQCLEVYRGAKDKRQFLAECGRLLGEL